MPKRPLEPVHVFCVGIALLGILVPCVLLVADPIGLDHFATGMYWALALSVLVGELYPLEIPRSSGDGEVTVSTMFSFALLLTAGLIPAIAAQALASALQDAFARKPLWRIGFNIGQYTLALAAAAAALALVLGQQPPLDSRFGPTELGGIVVGASAFFVVNTLLVSRATALYTDTPYFSALRGDVLFNLSVGAVLLCLSPIVVTVLDFSPVLFPLFFMPLIGIYRAGQQAARTAKAEHQASHDGLTELPNRRWFREEVDKVLNDPSLDRVAVVLVDLDRFKEVNDTLGHHHGDMVLRELGARLRSSMREQDLVARLGGDEFALCMRDVSELGAEEAVRRFQSALQVPFEVDGIHIELEASAGLAWYPDHGDDVATLLRRADVAMYRAKGQHLPLVTYRPEEDFHSHARLALVGDLRRALHEAQLVLHYQPQVDVRDGRAVAVEGLVRWNHPERGLLAPSDFIDVAEQTGLIKDLTYAVLSIGLRDLHHWRAEGRDLSLSLNIPARCLLDRIFPIEVERLLELHRVEGRLLTLELTESSVMVDADAAKATMEHLSRIGVSVAIDDFGTGYSSLAYLSDFPVDELKIDRTLLVGMPVDPRKAVIVKSTIELAHELNLRTVAEGIEDAETLERMLELGCDRAQGFHLSKPLPSEDLLRWWDARMAPEAQRVARNGVTVALPSIHAA
jgi:diguanylate cyclase (GGDEF)-like protein